jgi:phospho-N-acetylmuramoyl-pentapeptide-transferase
MISDVLIVIVPLVMSFVIGLALTPGLSDLMYRNRLWKRSARGNTIDNPNISAAFVDVHDDTAETSTPRIGGVVIWSAVLITIILVWVISKIFPTEAAGKLDFLSRGQTLLPLFGFVVASLIGLGDDLLQIFGHGKFFIDGISRGQRILIVTGIGLIGAFWFFTRLDISAISVPFGGMWELGWLFIPFFVAVVLGTFSSGIIDGLDGLAGGVFVSQFAAFATIAFFQSQFDLAAFSAAIAGGILAFLWFNIPPARFYMGETGVMGLTVTLALIAFFTDQVLLLPVIAFPLVVTSGSAIMQMVYRKVTGGKRLFKIAPLHHHFQAIGWSKEKITMRYWIVSLVCSIMGIMLAMLG